MRAPSLLIALLLLAAAAPAPRTSPGTQVAMRAQPGSPLDAAARQLVADDLAAASSRGDTPIVVTGTADLGGSRKAIFVQLQSERECGSAGCSTTVYSWERSGWARVLDGTTGKLTVSAKRTRGHADLITDDDHFVWTGTAYRSLDPAPAVDLRPRRRRP